MNMLFAGNNSHILRVDHVRDNDGALILDAVMSATLYEYDGTTTVGGFTWPIPLIHVAGGMYEGEVPPTVSIQPGRLYILKVVAKKGSTEAEWEGEVAAIKRNFDG